LFIEEHPERMIAQAKKREVILFISVKGLDYPKSKNKN
jgi:hypothetical protein